MIANIERYEKLKKELLLKMKASRLSLIKDFDTLFNDAFEKSYPGFERNYNPSLGFNEIGYLYTAVRNRIFSELEAKNKSILSFLEDINGIEKIIATNDEDDIIDRIDEKHFASKHYTREDFLRKFLTNKASTEDVTNEKVESILKTFEFHKPLFRLSAWSSEAILTNELVDNITQPLVSDFSSPQYFKWNYDTLFVRLKAWLIFD